MHSLVSNTIHYVKLSAQGNEFIVIDFSTPMAPPPANCIAQLADPEHGIGFDQLLGIEPTEDDAQFKVHIYNADGSYAAQCGNGMRALVHHLHRTRASLDVGRVLLHPPAGSVSVSGFRALSTDESWVAVTLPGPTDIRATAIPEPSRALGAMRVSMGNPHWILTWPHPPTAEECEHIGSALQTHADVSDGINVSFACRQNDKIHLRVYERGVGPTGACGSGACATVAAFMSHQPSHDPITVSQPGGEVVVNWSSTLRSQHQIELAGGVKQLRTGQWQWSSSQ